MPHIVNMGIFLVFWRQKNQWFMEIHNQREEAPRNLKIVVSENEWMRTLSPEQYRMNRLHAAERHFIGDYEG